MTPDNVVNGEVVEVRKTRPELWIPLFSDAREWWTGCPCRTKKEATDGYSEQNVKAFIFVPAEGSAPPPEVDAVEELTRYGLVCFKRTGSSIDREHRFRCYVCGKEQSTGFGLTTEQAAAQCLQKLQGTVPIQEAFERIREAGGHAWDKIDDPEAHINEMRGNT